MATITRVQNNKAATAGASSIAVTLAAPPTPGNLLVAGVLGGAASVTSVVDNYASPNSFLAGPALGTGQGGGILVALFALIVPAGPPDTYTVTVNYPTSTYGTLFVAEFSSSTGWCSMDGAGATFNDASLTTTPSVTITTLLEDLLVAISMDTDGGNPAVYTTTAPFTQLDIQPDGGSFGAGAISINPASSGSSQPAGTYTAAWGTPSVGAVSAVMGFTVAPLTVPIGQRLGGLRVSS